MSMLISSVVLAVIACAAHPTSTIEPQPVVTLADVVAKPQEYDEKPIRVRGRLQNAGTNYFKDRRIVLTDGKGNNLEVRPWLPLSRPPSSAQTQTGTTLADFLDHQVELEGTLTRRTEPSRQTEFIFTVKSAKIVEA